MTESNSLDYSSLQATIAADQLTTHGSELHGVLVGLICGGYQDEQTDYISLLSDVFNNNEPFSKSLSKQITQLFSQSWQDLLDENFSFSPLLPDDDETLQDRSNALSVWVQGFNLGFGLQQKDTQFLAKSSFSEEVKEVLQDFAEIANLSADIDEDEESEQAFYEIAEYVRLSVLLCFSEQATLPKASNTSSKLH